MKNIIHSVAKETISCAFGRVSKPIPANFFATTLFLSFLLAAGNVFSQRPFITTWKTDNGSSPTSITIPTTGGGYNYAVDWNNDGIYDQTGITGSVTHNFGTAGTYTIRIRGSFPRIFINNNNSSGKLLDISQWGDIAWTSMEGAFYGCYYLNISATDVPNLSGVTNMANMFNSCSSLNSPANIGDWNTANVTTMQSMFRSCSSFNQPIGAWNTANVTNMRGMFDSSSSFNQPIGTWNTAKVTSMDFMFSDADNFNQPIGDWNTAKVTTMSAMFQSAYAFNQPIGNWNTAKVTDMSFLFSTTQNFNQPIGDWNTAAVLNMENMFQHNPVFNQPVGNWNTGQLKNAERMFVGTDAFNQPIGDWNTANLTNMREMFWFAVSFNQPIGTWTLNPAVNMDKMLSNCGMDCENYSTTLMGWNNNPATPNNRSLGATGMKYEPNAVAARTNLDITKGWTFTGDALVPTVFYADTDGDGYGAGPGVNACSAWNGYVANNTDCNDANAAINPGATEIVADGIDQNCNGGDACYHDEDNDGYTTANPSTIASADFDCTDPNEESAIDSPADCNDAQASIKPAAAETCANSLDDDCDGMTDEGCGTPVEVCAGFDYLIASINEMPEPPADANAKFWLSTSLEYAKMFFQMGFDDWAVAMLGPSLEYESFRYWVFYFHSANPQKLTDVQKNYFNAAALDLIAAIQNGTAICGSTRPEDGAVTEVVEQEPTASEVKMIVSPNPTSGQMTVQLFDFEKSATGDLQVFDATGRMVLRQTLEPGTTRLDLDLSENGLANGFYTLRARVGEQVLTRKVSVVR